MAAQKAMPHKTGYVILTLQFEREDGVWVGTCIELETSTSADSLDEVQEQLHDLVTLHLNTLEDIGEHKRFFAEHDIKTHREDPAPTEDWVPRGLSLDLARLWASDLSRGPLFQPHPFVFPESEKVASGHVV